MASTDRVTRRQLQEALQCIDDAQGWECLFWACPGADAPYLPMATCHYCRAAQLVRRACKRLGIESRRP